MCRTSRSIDNRIHTMCMYAMTDEEKMADLGGELLEIFHAVCSHNTLRANEVADELCYYDDDYCDPSEDKQDMDQALLKLEVFMSESGRDNYEREIRNIFQIGHMIRIMDALKFIVYNTSKHGPEFVSILTTCYMNSFEYTNEEACEVLNMSLSTFYRKKRRAEILFGLAFLEYKAKVRGTTPVDFVTREGMQLSMAI